MVLDNRQFSSFQINNFYQESYTQQVWWFQIEVQFEIQFEIQFA